MLVDLPTVRGKVEKGKENAYSCVVLHADRPPPERKRNFAAFKDGDVRFLICTDVAARGLDIAGLPFVINMTLPSMSEDYIHRIGRVGRADCIGMAISLVATEPEKVPRGSRRAFMQRSRSIACPMTARCVLAHCLSAFSAMSCDARTHVRS